MAHLEQIIESPQHCWQKKEKKPSQKAMNEKIYQVTTCTQHFALLAIPPIRTE